MNAKQQDQMGEYLTERLQAMAHKWICEDQISPKVIAVSFGTIAGNLATEHMGTQKAADWFREMADVFDELSKPKEITIN